MFFEAFVFLRSCLFVDFPP